MKQTSAGPAPIPLLLNYASSPHPSIVGANDMVGKTIKDVQIGMTPHEHNTCHQSEMLVIEFTDGTKLAIDTGSNIANKCGDVKAKPSDFRVDLQLIWYEPK